MAWAWASLGNLTTTAWGLPHATNLKFLNPKP